MTRGETIECYMINDKKVIAEMLYDTIAKHESRTCESCKYYTSVTDYQDYKECSNDSLNKMDENLDVSDYYFRPSKDFSCNKWEQK